MIHIPIGSSGQTVVFASHVVRHFENARQLRPTHTEAGGQLFAKMKNGEILVERVTGPRSTDTRTRMLYLPDRSAEQEEINLMHAKGYHYVGDWHTHPDAYPLPSRVDVESIGECVRRSSHNLNGFLMVIVGTAPLPDALYVSLHDGQTLTVLKRAEPATAGGRALWPVRVLRRIRSRLI